MAKTYDGWDTEDKTVRTECSEAAEEEIYTTVFILGADTNKYNTLFNTLDTHFSLGNDQYPKKLEEAKGVLNSHRWDKTHYDSQKRKSSQSGKDPKKKRGNPERNNDNEPKVFREDMEFAQIERFCYCTAVARRITRATYVDRGTRFPRNNGPLQRLGRLERSSNFHKKGI